MTLLMAITIVSSAFADSEDFSVLYSFEAPTPVTFTSPLGSQPDTRPVLGPRNTVYGMTYDGGVNGNGVIYRYDLESHRYTVLHTFSALDASGNNDDGVAPGVALTRGPDDVFYGMASLGGKNGNGTIFKITMSGDFTVLHTFSALDANGNNEDGAYPLRDIVIGSDGKLYGETRIGGQNTCTLTSNGCGTAWVMDSSGHNFRVLHQFTSSEGHAASLLQSTGRLPLWLRGVAWNVFVRDPLALRNSVPYCAVGRDFEVLYTFSQTDANGENADGADCYELLVETRPGVFYGAAGFGGTNGSGVGFRYSLSNPGVVEVVHDFSAVNSTGQNWDGATPDGRLTIGQDGTLYSNTEAGGANGNGVIYSLREDGRFEVLHTFSATNPTTGANYDGANADNGVVLDGNRLIGIAIYGGAGSPAGYNYSGGTLYQLRLEGNAHSDDH
jgi:uncharacterized repeat protein (TIGR03803 family)